MTPEFIIAIPARLDATRLPGKPLRLLAGEPLIVHVARRALAAGAREVWVATDSGEVAAALEQTGVKVAMTASTHRSGSDRLAECAQIAGWRDQEIIINLQGDEPFAPLAGIGMVAQLLATDDAYMSTLAAPITTREELFDPNAVKVVRGANGHALYFSRAPIPWPREQSSALPAFPGPWLRHIGIYGYRAGFLRAIPSLPPSPLEQLESLEQLRVLESGYPIAVGLTPEPFPPGVDTPEDLMRAEAFIRNARHGD